MKTGRRFVRTAPCNEIRKERYLAHRDWNESLVVKDLINGSQGLISCINKNNELCRHIQIPKDQYWNTFSSQELALCS